MYVVPRKPGRWELRESRATAGGPRSRTLATFHVLTSDVVARALERSDRPDTPDAVRLAALRVGAPVQRQAADEAAAGLIRELAEGRAPSRAIRRLLAGSFPDAGAPSEAERAVGPWIAASPAERGEALRDLLLLADRLPARSRGGLRFPPFPPRSSR